MKVSRKMFMLQPLFAKGLLLILSGSKSKMELGKVGSHYYSNLTTNDRPRRCQLVFYDLTTIGDC